MSRPYLLVRGGWLQLFDCCRFLSTAAIIIILVVVAIVCDVAGRRRIILSGDLGVVRIGGVLIHIRAPFRGAWVASNSVDGFHRLGGRETRRSPSRAHQEFVFAAKSGPHFVRVVVVVFIAIQVARAVDRRRRGSLWALQAAADVVGYEPLTHLSQRPRFYLRRRAAYAHHDARPRSPPVAPSMEAILLYERLPVALELVLFWRPAHCIGQITRLGPPSRLGPLSRSRPPVDQ